MNTEQLAIMTKQIRCNIIIAITEAKSGHPGGSLSAVELMTVLYFDILKYKKGDPCWDSRDRVIFSKGHAAPLLYSCLAEIGYISRDELLTLRKIGSRLQGHPDCRKLPGVEVSSGSLGQGLSIACGIAIGLKMDGKSSRVYCLMGDGETQTGQIWEAAMCAAHYKIDNLCGILDYNGIQLDGPVSEIMEIAPVVDKWRSFGWNTIEIDGHNINEVLAAYKQAMKIKGKPTIIIAHTVKGKGVSFMENDVSWHGKAPSPEQCEIALKELKM